MAVHTFTPDHYYNTLGSHPPVLEIADGDTVVTTSVDAGGGDAREENVTHGPNPMTGPFFVTGAEPGDTLAVRLDRIWPNRPRGWTGSIVAAHVVDPGYVWKLPERKRIYWDLDLERGIARLADANTKLGRFEIPMEPMIGCFGVAPPGGQAISTATSSVNGGNMDYRGFCQGVTVYFPVWVPGALFHIGDGHATQGDGEIVGTGIEVSFDIRFTVQVLKGKKAGWPRAENDEYILTAGNARPLDQALQHATTEMMEWLIADYGLDAESVSAILGQCVRYEVGNVFDPAYTMICKVAKNLLPR